MRSRIIAACSMFFLFLALGATLATPAFCADPDWVLLDENKESQFFFDRSGTSKPKEGIVRVKTRAVYTKEGKADALKMMSAAKNLKDLYESNYMHDLECAAVQSRLLSATHLDKGGSSLKSTDLSSFTEWEAIPRDSRMYLVFAEVCRP